MLFDVDFFKKVNDQHGHPVGDEVLRLVGTALSVSARTGDIVARWGGEEFIAVLRTDGEGARLFSERARVAVENLGTAAGQVTVSVGYAVLSPGTDALQRADANLYEAKRLGRNRVVG